MAASKLRIQLTQLVQQIATPFQGRDPCFLESSYPMEFVSPLYDRTGRNWKWEIQEDGCLQTSNTCNSACTRDINEVSSAVPMFSKSSHPTELVSLLHDQTGRNRWREI